MRELSDKECDVIIDEARDGCNDGFVRLSYVYVRAGYAAGYRAAQEEQSAATPSSAGSRADHHGAAQAATDGPAADPLPVAWATPSLLVTMSAVEKRRLTSPEMRGRGGEWEADARDADRYSVPLYRADALERRARENAELRNANSSFASNTICHGSRSNGLQTCPKAPCDYCLHWQRERAERAEDRIKELAVTAQREVDNALRAEAERDALRAVVRAADAIWKTMTQTPDRTDAMAAYFTASAKVPK